MSSTASGAFERGTIRTSGVLPRCAPPTRTCAPAGVGEISILPAAGGADALRGAPCVSAPGVMGLAGSRPRATQNPTDARLATRATAAPAWPQFARERRVLLG